MRAIPNLLSISRFFCGPLIMLLLAHQSSAALAAIIVVMVLAEISDLLDGHIARYLDAGSDFGKILDPLADSLYRAVVFLAFLDAGLMPAWMVAVIFCRDILVSYVRIFSQQHGVTMGARPSGKIKAVAQAIAQIGTIVILLATGLPETAAAMVAIYVLLGAATLVTAWSGVDYAMGFFRSTSLWDMVTNRV